jgi:signal transduction histidine kinase/CheY-like chemotaxis protein/HPt (histidine-containing phosphotransfer) domain-containing protein
MLTGVAAEILFSKSLSVRRFVFFVSTTLIGLAANSMAFDIPFVVPFVIGNIAFLIILLRLGFVWSLISLVIVCAPFNSDIVWYNSVLQLICLLLFKFSSRHRWLKAIVVYTVSIGIIYRLFSVEVLIDSPALFITIVLLNCSIFLIFTKTVLMLNAISASPKEQKHQSLNLQLSNRIGLYVAVPATILIAFILQSAIARHLTSQLQFFDNQQAVFTSNIQRNVEGYISQTELVASLGRDNISGYMLSKIPALRAEFISALVTDENGTIVSFYKEDSPDDLLQDRSVADRSYFIMPKKLNQSYVSETFQGRTLGQDRLFAVSSPLYRDGVFDGVVEISVDLETLTKTLIADDTLKANRILLDGKFKKIWGGESLGRLGEVWTERPLLAPYNISSIQNFFFDTYKHIVFSADARYIVIQRNLDYLGWSTLYYLDTTPFIIRYSIYLGIAMMFGLLLLQYFTSLSSRLVRNYTNTLENIAQYAQGWNSDTTDIKSLTFKQTALDFEILSDSIIGMQERVLASRKAMQGSMEDVTLLNNELENRVKERTLQLEMERDKAKQLAAIKTRFLANMSHEIRTPITIIKGFTEELLGETSGDVYKVLKRINLNTLHLQNVINDILDTAKIDEGKMKLAVEPIDIVPFLEEIVESMMQIAKQKGLSLDCDIEGAHKIAVIADPYRLKQILLNLLSNAIKFTAKGCITLKAEKPENNTLTIKVVDEGIGMSEQQQKQLFLAFTQADSSTSRLYGGTGLGLHISKQLADAMNISLTSISEAGKGSTFMLTFNSLLLSEEITPLVDTALTPSPTIPNDLKTITGKILIVDDVEDIRRLLGSYLKQTNLQMLFAENGKEALEIALLEAPELIIIDQQMPIMDGYTAAQQLRELGFSSPIISLSADVFGDEQLKDTTSPFNASLSKPIKKAQLLEIVTSFFDAACNISSVDTILQANSDVYEKSLEEEEDEELRQDYLASLASLPEELALLVKSNDEEGIKMLLHKVKGTSACLELMGISNAAAEAEAALRAGKPLEEICREFSAAVNISRC